MTMYDSSHKKTHRLKALVLLASITSLGLFIDYLLEEPLLPNVNQSEILGFRSADRSIREYNINISDHIVNTVFSQVKHSAILSQPLDITYGPDTKMYKDVIKYWREKYDWRTREVYFNQYPQYTTIVQGLQIHFVHVKPETSNKTVPLLMLHGWPESFAYFYDIVPQLTSGNGDVSFELIIPSLPGHFMSDPMKDRTTVHVATLFKNLMKRLNIDRFYVFGQGVGSFIGTDMAILYPDKVMGLYNTMCLSLRKISLVKYASETIVNKVINTDKSKYDMWKSFNKMVYFLNYMQGNFINLDSLSITLSSSPIALASYIWNIISVGTDLEEYNNQLFGALQNMDEEKLIDVVMLMTISQSTTNSIRSLQQFVPMPLYQYPISTKVPCSCPKFTNQIFYQASWIYKDKFTNVVQATNFQEWGHRMLLQTDKSIKYKLSKDIFDSIKKMIDFH